MKVLLVILQYVFYPLSLLYQFLFFLDRKFTKPRKLPNTFVISVGNLSVGGTGKTPFTIYLARMIRENFPSDNLIILSRGYGGKKSKTGMVVLEDSDSKDCGDEPLLLKRTIPFANVIIGKNRYRSYLQFVKKNDHRNIILLDDGFQHHHLNRDFDFVLVDSLKKFDRFTIPVGTLRELPKSLKRANSIVFTKTESVKNQDLDEFQTSLQKKFSHLSFYHLKYKPTILQNISNKLEINEIEGKRIFLFSGIGNPGHFMETVKSLKPDQLEILTFRDHFAFSEKDVESIIQRGKAFDLMICTEKDYVKIERFAFIDGFQKIYFMGIEPKVDLEQNLKSEIIRLIEKREKKLA